MEPSAAAAKTVRFGLFEADLASGELRKRGRRVPLQEQPFQVLAALLRRHGEIVTREELQHALWPADTFVEFEQGLNTAIKRLRQALDDSADNPRFIETLPRKGYRFIAPVEVVRPAVAPETADPPAPAAPAMAPPSARKRRRWVWIAAMAALVALLLVTGLWPPPQPVVKVTQLTSDDLVKWGDPFQIAVFGGRVFYTANDLGESIWGTHIWSVPVAGGDPRREATPCPEGGGLLVYGIGYPRERLFLSCGLESGLWVQDPDGGNPKRIDPRVSGASWLEISPDLKTWLVNRPNGLFVKPVEGGAERLVARVEGMVGQHLFWHPSGARIGFERTLKGRSQLWEMRADGTGMRPLVPQFAGEQINGQWSPDGRRLYFVSNSKEGAGDIYLLDSRGWLGWMRGGAPVRLTSGPVRFDM